MAGKKKIKVAYPKGRTAVRRQASGKNAARKLARKHGGQC